MGDKQTRTVLSVEEKLAIFNYKVNRPDYSFENIGKIFTERWNIDEEEETEDPEVDDELIVLEEIVPGNSGVTGVTVAIPSETEDRNVKKRKQPPITDNFMKKHINKK